MESKINFDAMRIRLEFLYKTIAVCNELSLQQSGMNEREAEDLCSVVATAGCNLIYKHRIDGMFQYSRAEKANAHGIANVIVMAFQRIADEARKATQGLPITLAITRDELILQDGLDKLIEELKGLLQAQKETEVSNG